jgi:hypothetical protein
VGLWRQQQQAALRAPLPLLLALQRWAGPAPSRSRRQQASWALLALLARPLARAQLAPPPALRQVRALPWWRSLLGLALALALAPLALLALLVVAVTPPSAWLLLLGQRAGRRAGCSAWSHT